MRMIVFYDVQELEPRCKDGRVESWLHGSRTIFNLSLVWGEICPFIIIFVLKGKGENKRGIVTT